MFRLRSLLVLLFLLCILISPSLAASAENQNFMRQTQIDKISEDGFLRAVEQHYMNENSFDDLISKEGFIYQDREKSSGSGSKGLELVSNTTSFPYSAVVNLFARYGDYSYTNHCSGAMVDSFHVLTAGHCIYDWEDNMGLPDYIEVVPGQDGDERPFGLAWGVGLHPSDDWLQNADHNYDYGYITLDRRKGSSTGWFGMYGTTNDDWYIGTSFNIAGYPKSDRTHMYHDFNACYDIDEYFIYTYLETEDGMSGGPVWYYNESSDRKLVGIHKGHDSTSYHIRLTPDLIDWLKAGFDNDETPPSDFYDNWCSEYTGYDQCCLLSNPCGLKNNDVCDCNGKCDWDNNDCTSPSDDDYDSDNDDNYDDDYDDDNEPSDDDNHHDGKGCCGA